MKKLIALKPHYYSRELKVGEEYEAADDHAKLLVLLGQSRAAWAVEQENLSPPLPSKRQYRRRDLEAE